MQNFWDKVSKTKSCWNWIGYIGPKGYGVLKVNGKKLRVHRISWALNVGPIPKDLCVLHKCDNRKCVKPKHLFIGTIADNNRDMMQKKRWKRHAPAWNKGLVLASN